MIIPHYRSEYSKNAKQNIFTGRMTTGAKKKFSSLQELLYDRQGFEKRTFTGRFKKTRPQSLCHQMMNHTASVREGILRPTNKSIWTVNEKVNILTCKEE